MKKYIKLLLLTLGVLQNVKGFSQVGMTGNTQDRSVVLDVNAANKGMLVTSLSLSATTDTSGINGGTPAQGLLIYNSNQAISGTGAAGTGYYFWESGKWNKLVTFAEMKNTAWSVNGNTGTNPNVNYVGTSNNNDLVIKTNNLERMRITADGKVGIGVLSPSYLLETAGDTKFGSKLFLQNNTIAPLNNVSPLLRDSSTGRVYTVSSSTGNTNPFNYVKYSITVNRDWLSNFNTNIPISDYTVVVVGAALNEPGMSGMGVSYSGTFSPDLVYSFKSGSTWRLYADYAMADTWPYNPPVNGTWDLYCLVINNSMIASLPDQSFNLGGSNAGQASAPPSGL